MIKKQLEAYKAWCKVNNLKPSSYDNLKAYTSGGGLSVHLTTGFFWLLSIKTRQEEAAAALEEAAAYAIKNDLRFLYVVDGSHEMYQIVSMEISNDDRIQEMDTSDIMYMLDYYYIDLSEHGLSNIWLSMRDTKIDRITYDNTIHI